MNNHFKKWQPALVRPVAIAFLIMVLAASLLDPAQAASPEVKPAYALVNCRIFPVAQPVIEKGTILIRDGLIEAVGPAGKIQIPEDAELIEASGLNAYPGLISAHTNLFLEIKEQAQPATPEEYMAAFSQPAEPKEFPWLQIVEKIKPKKQTVETYHRVGITTVVVAPHEGIFQGQSVVLNLNSDQIHEMVLAQPWALHINFATERGVYPSSPMGTLAFIRQKFYDTQHYSQHLQKYRQSPHFLKRPEYDPFLEALLPFVIDKKPIVFQCNNLEEIKRALKIIKEFKLNAVLTGCNEAWRVSQQLKSASIPLLVTLDFRPPASSVYAQQGQAIREKAEKEIYPANASNLVKEKMNFSLTSFGLNDTDFVKNLRAAIKAGLPADQALRSLTIEPARTLGLEKQLGSLEPGKIANLILTRGELFDEKTKVVKVMVDGTVFTYEEKGQ
ncbi:MAG: amidohydrolase family protein [Candidatus Saccharicenans sp.]|nr:amidohydrolase family protein [Candidatus Saccharicenans sp.]